jgi:hypothetical protein
MENERYALSPDELIDAAYRVPLEDWRINNDNRLFDYEGEIDGLKVCIGKTPGSSVLLLFDISRVYPKYTIDAFSETMKTREGESVSVGNFQVEEPLLRKPNESEHLKSLRNLYGLVRGRFKEEVMKTKEQAVAAARDGLAGLVE